MSEEAQQCQFDESCSTGSSHYRKVISHIFGRNKKCTVNIPDSVWIYYCRKHYQRARYRNDEWPFTQCRLAIDTVSNMQAWGGVESFDLTLRRREGQRDPGELHQSGPGNQLVNSASSTTVATGPLDNPRPAPAISSHSSSSPACMLSVGGFAAINHHQPQQQQKQVVLPSSNSVRSAPRHGEETGSRQTSTTASSELHPSTAITSMTPATATSSPSKKRSPKSVPHPVPEWLHDRLGTRKSFDEVLQVLKDLQAYLQGITSQGQEALFPDIEILPNLRRQPPVKPQQNSTKKGTGSRVSGRGAVTKITKK